MSTCTLKQALEDWEKKANAQVKAEQAEAAKEIKLEEAVEVRINFSVSRGAINKVDNSLSKLVKCEILSLSTNCIDKIPNLSGMASLRVLSIGRNNIKKIIGLDEVAGTLEQLWISYNMIGSLDGLSSLTKLTTLYCSNNLLKSFSDLDKLAILPALKDVVFVGNPMYQDAKDDPRLEVMKVLPNLDKIDGDLTLELDKVRNTNNSPPEAPNAS